MIMFKPLILVGVALFFTVLGMIPLGFILSKGRNSAASVIFGALEVLFWLEIIAGTIYSIFAFASILIGKG